MILKNIIEPQMNSACVVGALAPYNHGLPQAGADETRIRNGLFQNGTDTIGVNGKHRVTHGFIRANPCPSVANKGFLE